MINLLKKHLINPQLKEIDYNSSELLDIQQQILLNKPIMKKVFSEFYDKCISLENKYIHCDGLRIEIGAGISFFNKIYPDVIISDIKKHSNIDIVVDAMNMPFEDNSVKIIYAINCLHHFPYPELFFNELSRTLNHNGGAIIIEPYYGPFATLVYNNLFNTETFNKKQIEWDNSSNYIMKGANQALSYIIFKRDKLIFQKKFPQLKIVYSKPLNNWLRYLLSGGLNFKQLVPNNFNNIIKCIELSLIPLVKIFALHHIIVIKKVKHTS